MIHKQFENRIYIINPHPESVCLSPLVSPEPLDLWSCYFACVIYLSYRRFLRKNFLENRKKKTFWKNFHDFFSKFFFFKNFRLQSFSSTKIYFWEIFFDFLIFHAGGRAQRAAGGCRRAKRAARRRPRCRSRRLRQQRVWLNRGTTRTTTTTRTRI